MSDSPKVTVSMDPDDYAVLEAVAHDQDRTVTAQARRVLRRWCREYNRDEED